MNVVARTVEKDPWGYWKARQRGEKPEIVNESPQCGYYRTYQKNQKPLPVCIFPEGDKLVLVVGGREALGDINTVWTWCCQHDISEELYRLVAEDQKEWPDLDAFVAAQLDKERAGIGGNNPPQDEVKETKEQIEAAAEQVKQYAKIKDDATAGAAQTLRAYLLKLAREAKNRHGILKAPHWEKVKEIDTAWLPMVKDAETAAGNVARSIEAYFDDKRREAERVRREQEEAQRKAEEAANDAAAKGEPMPELPVPAPVAAPVAAQIKGAFGKAGSLKAKPTVTAITDVVACATFFRESEVLKACLMKLAQAQIEAGNKDVPGVTVEDKTKLR